MTDTRKHTVTFKGSNMEDPWLVLGGDTAQELAEEIVSTLGMQETEAGTVAELMAEGGVKYRALLNAAKGLGATAMAQPQQQGGYQQQQAAPQAQQANGAQPGDKIKDGGRPVPPGPRPACMHGPRQWISGVNAKGQFGFWACNQPQGQQCKSEWAAR